MTTTSAFTEFDLLTFGESFLFKFVSCFGVGIVEHVQEGKPEGLAPMKYLLSCEGTNNT